MLPRTPNNAILGTLLGVGGALMFALMAVLVHKCGNQITSGEILFVRAMSGIIVLALVCRRSLYMLFTKAALFVWLRAIFGSFSVYCYYWTIRRSSPGIATVMSDLAPVFVMLYSIILFKIKIRMLAILGTLLAVIGVIGLSSFGVSNIRGIVVIIGLLGASFGGAAYVSLKQATARFSTFQIIWAFSVPMVALALFDLPAPSKLFTDYFQSFSWGLALPLIGAVVASYLAQFMMTLSYKFLSVSLASILGLTASLWALCFDWWLGILPSATQLVSVCVILIGIRLCMNEK